MWWDCENPSSNNNEDYLTTVDVLCDFVKNNDEKKLKLFFKRKNIDKVINQQNEDGKTAVYIACETSQPNCLKLLLQNDADCNIECEGNTPAFIALKKASENPQNADCIKILIKIGAKVNVSDPFDCSEGDLLKRFFDFVSSKENDAVDKLQQFLSDEENLQLINKCDKLERTALHIAVLSNNPEILKLLIKQNADISKKDIKKRTPLWIAAKKNHVECLKILLTKNADVNETNFKNTSVLQAAAINNNVDCLKLLLKKNVDLSLNNYRDESVVQSFINNVDNYETLLTEAFDSRIVFNNGKNIKKPFECNFEILAPRKLVQMNVICDIFEKCKGKEENQIYSHPIFVLFLGRKNLMNIYNIFLIIEFFFVVFYWFVALWFSIMLRDAENRYELEIYYGRFVFLLIIFIRLKLGLIKLHTMPYMWHHKMSLLTNCINPLMLLVISLIDIIATQLNSFKMFHNYIVYFVSLTFLLVCIEPFLFFGRLFKLEDYVDMFFVISYRVLKVFLLFFWILSGFAISFHILFSHYQQFGDVLSSTFKTIVMMTGEFEYEDIFKNETNDRNTAERLASPIPKLIFMLFINLICIVFGNLIIGMSIEDIRKLRKKSHVKSVQRQIERFAQIEIFFKWHANYFALKCITNLAKKILEKCCVEKKCSFSEDEIRRLSPKLLNRLKKIYKHKPQDTKADINND